MLYSNYCLDIGLDYEHGYDVVFSEFEPLFLAASNDPHARESHAGSELAADTIAHGYDVAAVAGDLNLGSPVSNRPYSTLRNKT